MLRVVRSAAAEVRLVSQQRSTLVVWWRSHDVNFTQVSEAKSRHLKKRKEQLYIVLFFHLPLHLIIIWRTTLASPGKGASNAEIVRPFIHFPPSLPLQLTCHQLQSATSLRIVRHRSGSATTAANQGTSHRHAPSLAASQPNNVTRAVA